MTRILNAILKTSTISSGQTIGSAATLDKVTLLGVQMPSGFTGTAITFQVSVDGSTYQTVYDTSTGVAYGFAVSASRSYPIDPALFVAWNYVKVVSNAAEGADRAVKLSARPIS